MIKPGKMNFENTPTLTNTMVQLRALTPDDYDALFAVASEQKLWEYHPIGDGYTQKGFRKFFAEALKAGSLMIIDTASKKAIGCTRLYAYNEQESSVVIGHTFIASAYWGKGYNRSVKQLMLEYAFRYVKNVLFYVVKDNLRSQKALQKIGAIETGTVVRVYEDKALRCFIYEIKQLEFAGSQVSSLL